MESTAHDRCRAINTQFEVRCWGNVNDLSIHAEDHWAWVSGMKVEWTDSMSRRCTCGPKGHARAGACLSPAVGSAGPELVDVPAPASETQVGGNHYRRFKIQPWDIVDEYELGFYAGNALKYLLRAGHKGAKVQDLKKCRHYLDKMIELEESRGEE